MADTDTDSDTGSPSGGGKRTRMEPPVSEVTKPFWDATREERLLLQWCTSCDKPVFYPREACPSCLGFDLDWRPSAGRGVVYAVSVQYKPNFPGLADKVPYAVVLVDLDEGVRLMSNVVDCDIGDVVIGLPVELTWEPLSDGRNLPQFRPLQEA